MQYLRKGVVLLATCCVFGAASARAQQMMLGDDNSQPSITLSASAGSFAENGGSLTITATASVAPPRDVTVYLSFAGSASSRDYSVSSNSIVIPAGSTSGSITISGTEDSYYEGTETLVVGISNVINGVEAMEQQVNITITDDDPYNP